MKKLIFLILFSIFYFLFSGAVFAASSSVYRFESDTKEIAIGSQFIVKILVDSLRPVNGYSFDVLYDTASAKLINLVDAGSIVDFWRTRPEVFGGGRISFEGASIKPFSGTDGLIYELVFESLAAGEFRIRFAPKSYAYLANGKGTRVDPEPRDLELIISSEQGQASSTWDNETTRDTLPPTIKLVSITSDPITEGQKLLSYLAKDDDSGVKNVTVRFKRWFLWGDSIRAAASMSVPRGVWATDFLVVDNSGNFSRRVIYDWDNFVMYVLPTLVAFILLLIVLINRVFSHKKV